MYTTKIKRELVQPGQLVRLDGITYTASAQRNGRLYVWRQVPGAVRWGNDCRFTTDREVDLVIDEKNFRQIRNDC